MIENNEALRTYCEACVVEPTDKIALFDQLGMEDTLDLRERVMGFFLTAERRRKASAEPSTSSSSNSIGSQASS